MSAFSLSRREWLGGLAALGAGTWLRGQTAQGIIDCHHHFVSPAFLKALTAKQGHKTPGFTSYFPLGLWQNYSPARDIELMDKQGVATAMISVTSPGVYFGDRDEARNLAREMNEYGAKMAADYKGRFGLFALLPLPLIDESLREIEYAFDTLKADGVGILTSYGNHWLGEPMFQPIFDELHIRLDNVINIDVDEKEIIERLSRRIVCKSCGKIYNSELDHFNTADRCFKCGGELTQRSDDRPETVRERLKVYWTETKPVKEFYERMGILHDVDGVGGIVDITIRLLTLLRH